MCYDLSIENSKISSKNFFTRNENIDLVKFPQKNEEIIMNCIQSSCDTTWIHWTPRVISAIAVTVAILALITLGIQHASLFGTTSQVSPWFQMGCLNTAKWAALISAGAVAIGIVKDLAFALGKDSSFSFRDEFCITVLSPFGCCLLSLLR